MDDLLTYCTAKPTQSHQNMSELWAGEEPSVVPSLLLLRLAGCHSAGASVGQPCGGEPLSTWGRAARDGTWALGTKKGEQSLRRGTWNVQNIPSWMLRSLPLHCRGWRGWMWCEESLSAKACSVCRLASGLWNTLLSLDKALKYSCSFIIKLLSKMMVECGYNFKQGTMFVHFQSAAHKPNSCSRTCWARAWTSKCVLLIIGSSPAEDLVP